MSGAGRLEHRIVTPRQQRYPRPLLLIHGAWHGAWCWEAAMHDFAERGFVVHAISLRGHGASERPALFNLSGIAAYLDDIHRAVSAIDPTPIVVAHSLGGFLMQHYLGRHPLPGLILLCSMPPQGPRRFVAEWLRRHPLAVLKTLLTVNGRHLVGTPELAREAFFSAALSEEQVRTYTAQLGPEPAVVGAQSVLRPPKPPVGATPMLVLAAADDQIFSLEEQRGIAVAYQAPLVSIPGAAHDLMLDPAWPSAAAVIERTVSSWTGAER